MAKRQTYEGDGMGDLTPGQVQSPLSFQRTDGDSMDSLLEPRPSVTIGCPKDTVGFIPKQTKMGKV